ncbi:MAG: trypsin-like peptidase domain-containing protein [Planctomycetota bacterium]
MPIRWYGPSLILLFTVVAVMLLGPRIARSLAWNHSEANIQQVRQDLVESPTLSTLSEAFSKVSEVVEPSVVHIQTFGPSARSGGGFFSRFDPLDPVGNGSGWVYQHTDTESGETKNYILTNHHVVATASRIRVRFADGSEHTARLVNSDELTDVAVLQVPDQFLHPATLNPEPVKKGQIVFAFGSPFRFDFSVSQGIVSASGRRLDIGNSGKYEDFIQTDAAINPGNSGGPLTDIYGRVVGMNTAIASSRTNPNDPGGFMGLGFAIPVDMAVDVATRIIEEGDVRRGYLGVLIRDLDPRLAASFGFDGEGILVEHPVGGGAADEAGMRPGDIITAINGQPVGSVDDLRYTVAGFPPGSTVQVSLMRGGQESILSVTLAELPEQSTATRQLTPRFRFSPLTTVQDDRLRELGIGRIADFSADDARANGLRPVEGVIVIDARPGSIAFRQSVQAQSIITHVGETPVRSTAEFLQALDQYPEAIPLRITALTFDPSMDELVSRFALLEIDPE